MESALAGATFVEEEDFHICFMTCAYNTKAGWGEFYIETRVPIWEHDLAEYFENAGAKLVVSASYLMDSQLEAATNTLSFIWSHARRTGHYEQVGACPEKLFLLAKAKSDESEDYLSVKRARTSV